MDAELEKILKSAHLARLIPVVSDSKKEERATSSLLATFSIVPEFARQALTEAGAPVGKRINILCYTEVIFNISDKEKSCRPDGLIIISNGSKKWLALVEAKIGNNLLETDQVEKYLDIAKKYGINSVITISNQFATTPTHHPLKINKTKLRAVDLYHFSWLSLVSKAILISDNKGIDDTERSYILNELVRYLEHDSTGVSELSKMHADWKNTCAHVQQDIKLQKNSDVVVNSVASWHQLQRHQSLKLSKSIGSNVSIYLSRQRINSAELNLSEDCTNLSETSTLGTEFIVQNAASKINFCADFRRKTISISMKLDAPKDKTRGTASINWLTRQLKEKEVSRTNLKAYWPKRLGVTSSSVQEAMEDPTILLPSGENALPTYLEVTRVIDLAARFKGAKTFVEDASNEFILFYNDVGQHLNKWVTPPPKLKPDVIPQPSEETE